MSFTTGGIRYNAKGAYIWVQGWLKNRCDRPPDEVFQVAAIYSLCEGFKNMPILPSSNGRTTDSEFVNRGSNP